VSRWFNTTQPLDLAALRGRVDDLPLGMLLGRLLAEDRATQIHPCYPRETRSD